MSQVASLRSGSTKRPERSIQWQAIADRFRQQESSGINPNDPSATALTDRLCTQLGTRRVPSGATYPVPLKSGRSKTGLPAEESHYNVPKSLS